jgi:hypothetical protein
MPREGIKGDEWGAYVTLSRISETNAGSPTGREPYGDTGPVVVAGVTTCQGGGNTVRRAKGARRWMFYIREVCAMQDAETVLNVLRESLESLVLGNQPAGFGPGVAGKGPAFGGHLASGLPVYRVIAWCYTGRPDRKPRLSPSARRSRQAGLCPGCVLTPRPPRQRCDSGVQRAGHPVSRSGGGRRTGWRWSEVAVVRAASAGRCDCPDIVRSVVPDDPGWFGGGRAPGPGSCG